MEDVLAVYRRQRDPDCPLVCLDETSKQMLVETRVAIPIKPGRLADVHFAGARTIVLVQDNLNIHCKASLYEAFSAAEARRLVECFEWHFTPKAWQLARSG
jgi:hypothetical protein